MDQRVGAPDLVVATLAERPDLAVRARDFVDESVAEFLYQDPVSVALFVDLVGRHPDFTLMAVDRATGDPAAIVCTMPFTPAGEASAASASAA